VTTLVLLALAAPSRAAEAARDGQIVLQVNACERPFEASLREILLIELGDLLEPEGVMRAADGEAIEITCDANTAKIVGLGARGEVVHHDLRLDTFPGDAAPRAVALAALEALRAVDPTLAERMEARRAAATPSPPVAPAPPPPRASHPRPKSSVPSSGHPAGFTRLLAGGVARWFMGDPRTLAPGARLELSRRFTSPWDAGFDLDGSFVRRTVDLGIVEARLLSAGAWVGLRAGSSEWSATGGIGGRLGLALLKGAARDAGSRGHRKARPWGGPTLVLRTDAATGAFALALAIEGGLAVAGAEGLSAGEPAIAFTNGWASASASAGLRF
jgi:hypothetical protein